MTTGHLINGVGVETCFLMVAEDFSIQNRKTKKRKKEKNQPNYFKGLYAEMKVTPEHLTAWWLNYSHRIWEIERSQTQGLMSSQASTLIMGNECLHPHVQVFHCRTEQFFL